MGCVSRLHFYPLFHLQHAVHGGGGGGAGGEWRLFLASPSFLLAWMQPPLPTSFSHLYLPEGSILVRRPGSSRIHFCHILLPSPFQPFPCGPSSGPAINHFFYNWSRSPSHRNKQLRAWPGPDPSFFSGQVSPPALQLLEETLLFLKSLLSSLRLVVTPCCMYLKIMNEIQNSHCRVVLKKEMKLHHLTMVFQVQERYCGCSVYSLTEDRRM